MALPEVQNARKFPGSAFGPAASWLQLPHSRESGPWAGHLSPAHCGTTRTNRAFSPPSWDLHGTVNAACAVWELLSEDTGMDIIYFNSHVFIFMFL